MKPAVGTHQQSGHRGDLVRGAGASGRAVIDHLSVALATRSGERSDIDHVVIGPGAACGRSTLIGIPARAAASRVGARKLALIAATSSANALEPAGSSTVATRPGSQVWTPHRTGIRGRLTDRDRLRRGHGAGVGDLPRGGGLRQQPGPGGARVQGA